MPSQSSQKEFLIRVKTKTAHRSDYIFRYKNKFTLKFSISLPSIFLYNCQIVVLIWCKIQMKIRKKFVQFPLMCKLDRGHVKVKLTTSNALQMKLMGKMHKVSKRCLRKFYFTYWLKHALYIAPKGSF